MFSVVGLTRSACTKFKGRIVGYLCLTLIGSAVNILSPYILLELLSLPALETATTYGLLLISGYGLAWTAGRLIPIFRDKLLAPINTHLSTDLSQKIAKHFFLLPLDYQLSAPTGRAAFLITKSYYSIIKLIASSLGNITPTVVEALTAAGILTFLYGPIGLSQLGVLVIYTGSSVFSAKWITKAQKEEFEKSFAFAGHYHSMFNNYENAHYFNNVDYELNKFSKEASVFRIALNKTLRLIENSSIRQGIIVGLGFTGVTLLATYKMSTGNFTFIDFFVVNLYNAQFSLSLDNFSSAINSLQGAIIDAKNVTDFLNNETVVSDYSTIPLLVKRNNATIEFRNISFAYKDKFILDNLSFNIKAGQKVAIVGLSGEGKSTILKLLFRFYDPISGDIFINRQNIKNVTLSSLRAAIAIVPQNPVLFNTSIRENIRYGRMDASNKLIEQAASYAGLSDFVNSQPDGFETLVGEQGNKISGGQKQRVAIARAILKKASLFVFDEATSSLDVKTEREVQENLDNVSEGYTTLIVTHRLTTIINSDNIIYLKDGKICEQGSYTELMKLKGLFYQQMLEHCKNLGFNIEELRPLPRRRELLQPCDEKDYCKLNQSQSEIVEVDDVVAKAFPYVNFGIHQDMQSKEIELCEPLLNKDNAPKSSPKCTVM